jgi:hypothetical protein
MTKSGIISSVLKNLRDSSTDEKVRSSAYADDQNDVVSRRETIFQEAEPGANIRTRSDFIHLDVESCDNHHNFGFPFDMSPMDELKTSGHAWICCAIETALGESIVVKHQPCEMLVESAGYKPFADFIGGSKANDGK